MNPKNDAIELIGRWNHGEVSPGDLVARLLEPLMRRLEDKALPLTKESERHLILSLSTAVPQKFATLGHFLTYAESTIRLALGIQPTKRPIEFRPNLNYIADPEDINIWNDVRSISFEEQSGLEASRSLEILEQMEESEGHDRSDSAGGISFSSLAFAPTLDLSGIGLTSELEGFMPVIERIRASDSSLARFAALRLFGGLTLVEIAKRTSSPLASVRHSWELLKAELSIQQKTSPVAILGVDVQLLRTIQTHPELLGTLDWRSFEKVLAEVLDRLGFEIELQRGTKDGGVDIFALRGDSTFGSHRYLIQAKRWTSRVGIEPVRELLFLQEHYRVSKGCLATTARFTRGAWQLANEYKWRLELRDIEGIREWIGLALK